MISMKLNVPYLGKLTDTMPNKFTGVEIEIKDSGVKLYMRGKYRNLNKIMFNNHSGDYKKFMDLVDNTVLVLKLFYKGTETSKIFIPTNFHNTSNRESIRNILMRYLYFIKINAARLPHFALLHPNSFMGNGGYMFVGNKINEIHVDQISIYADEVLLALNDNYNYASILAGHNVLEGRFKLVDGIPHVLIGNSVYKIGEYGEVVPVKLALIDGHEFFEG